ncbi:hypothetical protein [Chitinophaga qingshengii]|uniref:Uncharacterized protein n=1 Tax=Chitinophaga qingshengii TaxID=1569794 RepID=A0ABR7TUJ3_9BACT|nr:hypothetical protein [Chitinophaga qingshengii]MBC9934133.1 hypothetical protein [Chitinophaga qingshengii]
MNKSMMTLVRWGLVISVVIQLRDTTETKQESVSSGRGCYLIDPEDVVSKRGEHNEKLPPLRGRNVFPMEVLHVYGEEKVGKYYQMEDGKLLFVEEKRR